MSQPVSIEEYTLPFIARRIRPTVLLAVVMLAATLISWPASRADAVDSSKPTPCTEEPLITDKVGDQISDLTGLGTETGEGPANMDIKSVFLNYRAGADGKKVVTANIQIADLNKELPSPLDTQGGIYYYVHYTSGGVERFVKAVNADGATITYHYGFFDAESVPTFIVYNTEGETKGAFFEGADGVVQIDIPESTGAKEGATLSGVYADVDYIKGVDDFYGINSHADVAPDSGTGTSYEVVDCAAAAAAEGGGTATAVTLTVPKTLGSARSANRRRTLPVKVRSSESVSNLTAQLRSGKTARGRLVGKGSMKTLDGSGTLRLKLSRKVKKGTYTLVVKGTAGDAAFTVTKPVKLKS
jgi:hypothetical protein